jgi:hypothetical protein
MAFSQGHCGAQYSPAIPGKNINVMAWDFSIGPTIRKLYAEWGAKP